MTSVADALWSLASRAATSIVVVGTAKDVGKTVTFGALLAAARRAGVVAGITSIGRDGEPVDALDERPKPRVHVAAGTYVALPRALLPRAPALEILGTGAVTALGPLVFARAPLPLTCEIGGPPTASGVRVTMARLASLGAACVIVDGALDRVAALAGGDDAVIVATGAAAGADVTRVAAAAGETVARLALPGREPARERARIVRVDGALDARDAAQLLEDAAGATVVVDDPTRVVVRGALLARLRAQCDLRCERPLRVVACTVSSASRTRLFEPRALVRAVAAATALPTFDVLAELAA